MTFSHREWHLRALDIRFTFWLSIDFPFSIDRLSMHHRTLSLSSLFLSLLFIFCELFYSHPSGRLLLLLDDGAHWNHLKSSQWNHSTKSLSVSSLSFAFSWNIFACLLDLLDSFKNGSLELSNVSFIFAWMASLALPELSASPRISQSTMRKWLEPFQFLQINFN